MMPLTAKIEVPAGQTDLKEFQIRLRISNQGPGRVALLNPDMGVPTPAMDWRYSNATYQTSLLISFGYLSMSVTDATGQVLPVQAIQTWATPVLRQKLELAPGDSVELAIPIGAFYDLVPGRYLVAVDYGDRALKIGAREHVTVPPSHPAPGGP